MMDGPRFNPDLLKVPLYIAGKSIEEVKEELGLGEVIKLASNESPVGPSPKAIQAAECLLNQAHRYPGIAERDLRRKLADYLGRDLTEQNIVTGNGGTDILRMITQAFVFDGGNTVMSSMTFPMYYILTTTFGGTCRQVTPTETYHHDLEAMADQIDGDTRLLFVCSPNNPTGMVVTRAEAERLMDRIPPHVVVVFDESYIDYVSDSEHADNLDFVAQGYNVLLVRSFSKAAGLANLRIGYLIGPAQLADYVRHASLPFHTGDIVLAAASASLDDRDYQEKHKQAVYEGREYLYRSLHEIGLNCLPSHANFLAIQDPPFGAARLTEMLLQQGIIVRAMGAFGMPDGVRITVGTPAENEFLIETLKTILETGD